MAESERLVLSAHLQEVALPAEGLAFLEMVVALPDDFGFSVQSLASALRGYSLAVTAPQSYERNTGQLNRLVRIYSAVTGVTVARTKGRRGTRFDLSREQFELLLLTVIRAQDEQVTPESVMRQLLGLPAEGYGLLAGSRDGAVAASAPGAVDGAPSVVSSPAPEQWAELRREVAALRAEVQARLAVSMPAEDPALRSTVAVLQEEVAALRSEVAVLRTEVSARSSSGSGQVEQLRTDLAALRSEFMTLQRALGPVQERGFEKVVMTLAVMAERLDLDWDDLQAEVAESLVSVEGED